jgi:hypothetical protein
VAFVYGGQPGEDDLAVDELITEEGCDEVLVLFPEGAELGDAQIFLVQAPSGVLRFSVRSCRVGVLDYDKPVAPAHWQGRRVKVDAVDAETVEFLEWGEFARDPFDYVREAGGSSLSPAIGRMSISADIVASGGSWSSRKVPRMDWEPTTITAGLPMIWQAVRIACSS